MEDFLVNFVRVFELPKIDTLDGADDFDLGGVWK
jgi:hypothetical protein